MPKQLVPLDVISAQDRQRIEEQMERLLAHQLFRLSRRLPAFLAFAVRESMEQNNSFPPKERRLGIEVFGRKPDYDTSADPIVRVTAMELRKKLAQYYYAEGHEDEIRIELPLGSYLPRFWRTIEANELTPGPSTPTPSTPAPPGPVLSVPASEAIDLPAPMLPDALATGPSDLPFADTHTPVHPEDLADHPLLEDPHPAPQAPVVERGHSRWRTLALILAVLLIAALSGYLPLLSRQRPTRIDLFWKDFLKGSDSATIVMPVIQSQGQLASNKPSDVSVAPNLSIEDTTIASRVAAQLEKTGAHYWLGSSSEVNFGELRTGPAVLIGALDNVWTSRLSKDLPFFFEESQDGRTGRIVEVGPVAGHRVWALDITTPHGRIGHDYGIVARFRSKLTGEPMIIIAGISSQGTQAAGEILTTPAEFSSLLGDIPDHENFELVIETDAIEGRAGPPHIIATKVW